MACLQRLRREQQRRCKADERATTRSLLMLLDGLVPSSSSLNCLPHGHHDFSSSTTLKCSATVASAPPSKRKGLLVSGRTKEQLLQDAIAFVGYIKPRKRRKTQADSAQEAPCEISGGDLMDALLSCRRERILIVDLSSWTITSMSHRLCMDWQESVFSSNMVGQCLLHFVTVHDMDKLRNFVRELEARQGTGGPCLPFRAGLRAFRKSNVVVLDLQFIPLYAKSAGKGIFLLRPEGQEVCEPDWLRCKLKDVSGEMFFKEEMSTASMWHVQEALKACGSRTSKTFFSWLYPSISSTEASQKILDVTARASHGGPSVKKVIFDFLMRHMGLHVMLDAASSSEAQIHLHVRLHMPYWMGGIKTPWVNLQSHCLNGKPIAKLSDQHQDIFVFSEWRDENIPYKIIAFFCTPSTGICFHTRTWSFSSSGVLHEGQVFKSVMEEPFRYRIFLQKEHEVDITLLAHLID
mmetsp:Transcript_8631/g.28782  ORF Transcript_8631/g.28782 Transcript_8631/m.28782 type:complete len:464 (-) Transcript_8631:916-2307(-)